MQTILHDLGQPEIGNLAIPIHHQDVINLQVGVVHTHLVHVHESDGDLQDIRLSVLQRNLVAIISWDSVTLQGTDLVFQVAVGLLHDEGDDLFGGVFGIFVDVVAVVADNRVVLQSRHHVQLHEDPLARDSLIWRAFLNRDNTVVVHAMLNGNEHYNPRYTVPQAPWPICFSRL